MQSWNSKTLTRAALIAALYVTLTMALQPISFGPLQLRVAEAMTLLPFLMPQAAIPGLAIGCFFSNMLGGYGLPDMVFGTAATLVAALLTARCRSRLLAAAPPVLLNALVVGVLQYILYYGGAVPLWLPILQVGSGQLAACYGLGIPLLLLVERRFPQLAERTPRTLAKSKRIWYNK